MVLQRDFIPLLVAVRYSWEADPICNLYNGAGLPAVPFRTDDWGILVTGESPKR